MDPEPAWTAFLELVYRPDIGLLNGRWLRSITDAELRAGYEAVRQAALHHGCQCWLMDARRRVDRSMNGREWVVTEFLPWVQPQLGKPLYVAFLVLPNHLEEVEGTAARPSAVSTTSQPYQFARFLEERTATEWLNTRQQRA